MSKNSNVVPLREADHPEPLQHAQQFEQLLEKCRNLAHARLSQSLAGMLHNAGDTLWELSKATQDRDTQKLYMEAQAKLLPQRKLMEERFRNHYLTEFDNRVGQARNTKPSFSDYTDGSPELGLVGEDDLNESLKVNEMAGKLRGYCEEELVALDQRAGVLLGDANLTADNNPFSPRAICDAFKHACRDIEPDVRIRMVLIKLFDDHVLDDIRSIYKAVNALLVQHSILPKIRYGRSRNQEAGGPATGTAAGVPGNAGAGDAAHSSEQDIFSVLRSLVAANAKTIGQHGAGTRPQAGPGTPEGVVQVPGFPPLFAPPGQVEGAARILLEGAALLGSLTRIQRGDFSQAGGTWPLPTDATEASATNVLHGLKNTSVGTGMGQIDIATLDIMALLFDRILEDRKIPDGIKWLIGRLQIPMLKVAILDKSFFSSRTHPARQLLDALGEIAVGLPPDLDSSNPIYKRVEAIVEKLIDCFEESLEIFDSLRRELREVIAQENQRAEEQTRSAAKRIEQKEMLAVAKVLARDEIKARLQAGPIHKTVVQFLAQQWIKLLLITYAQRGKDSDAWKSALETMDLLIWSVRSKPSPEERRELASLLPGLLKRLAAGMQIAGTRGSTRKAFLADLMKLHTKVLGGPVAHSAPQAKPNAPGSAQAVVSADAPTQGLPPSSSEARADKPPAQRDDATASEPSTGDQAESDSSSLDFTTLIANAPAARPAGVNEPPAQRDDATASEPSARDQAESDSSSLDFTTLILNGPAARPPGVNEPPAQRDEPTALEPNAGDQAESDSSSLDSTLIVKNPFGEGEIRVGEIELSSVPGAPGVAEKEGDEYSQLASGLSIGTWLEFRDDKQRHQVRLSYVSPFKTAYLFVDWQAKTVGDYSLHELAAELRAGRAAVMNQVPLFDRAMNGLMSTLRG